jgi:PIN domain nuclease of toxin-antitoxin system
VRSLVLFDTHVIIWSITGDRRLGRETRRLLQSAVSAGAAAISSAAVYELVWIAIQGRAKMETPYPAVLDGIIQAGFRILDIDEHTARSAAELALAHGDPIDRFIAAGAVNRAALLVTADEQLLDAALGIATHDARL